jgi:hypothetical protein
MGDSAKTPFVRSPRELDSGTRRHQRRKAFHSYESLPVVSVLTNQTR